MKTKFHLKMNQLDRLSEYAANLSLLFLGSFVLPFFIKVDKVNLLALVLGLLGALIALAISLLLAGERI